MIGNMEWVIFEICSKTLSIVGNCHRVVDPLEMCQVCLGAGS